MARKSKAVQVQAVQVFTKDEAAQMLAQIRSGYGASTAIAKRIAEGNFDGVGLYQAFEEDAKAHGEDIGKSRTLAAVRMAWTRLETGKGLSMKDGKVAVVDKNTAIAAAASQGRGARQPASGATRTVKVADQAPAQFVPAGDTDGRAEQFKTAQATIASLIAGAGLEESQRMAAAMVATLQRLGFKVTIG